MNMRAPKLWKVEVTSEQLESILHPTDVEALNFWPFPDSIKVPDRGDVLAFCLSRRILAVARVTELRSFARDGRSVRGQLSRGREVHWDTRRVRKLLTNLVMPERLADEEPDVILFGSTVPFSQLPGIEQQRIWDKRDAKLEMASALAALDAGSGGALS